MNCREGDIARIVKSMADNRDKLVRCLRLATQVDRNWIERIGPIIDSGPIWMIDRPIRWRDSRGLDIGFFDMCPDTNLRPIRGEEGADESLEWAEAPPKHELIAKIDALQAQVPNG